MKIQSTIFSDRQIKRIDKKDLIYATPQGSMEKPVMFITYVCAIALLLYVAVEISQGVISSFNIQLTLWLWFTVLFAKLCPAVAVSRGKAHAASLKKTKIDAYARHIQHGIEVKTPLKTLKRVISSSVRGVM